MRRRSEADEDGGRGVLEDEDDRGGAEQAEPDAEHAGHGAGAEGDPERAGHAAALGAAAAVRTLPRTAMLMPMKPVRPEKAAPKRKPITR